MLRIGLSLVLIRGGRVDSGVTVCSFEGGGAYCMCDKEG